MTSRTFGLRTTGLGRGPGAAAVASACAACAAALACTALAICAVFTTLEKELRKPPAAEPPLGGVEEEEEEAGPEAWGWGDTAGGCLLSMAGDAGELVELLGRAGGDGVGEGDGRCRSIM